MYRKLLLLIFFVAFLIYIPSLSTFFTNDDFFHLKISNARNLGEFLNFFNLFKAPDGFGFYRPLTTQVFYFLGTKIFGLHTFPLHIFSLVTFLAGVHLLYRLTLVLSNNRNVSILTCFFYTFSSIHFGHLYFLGTFQELGLFFFFIFSLLTFTRYLKGNKKSDYYLSIVFFVISLTCKETAVVLPGIFLLVWVYLKYRDKKISSFVSVVKLLTPFILILCAYLYFHIFFYGLVTGDSYGTDFSVKKTINSLVWYLLWTLGIPETFVDFVGPGLKINSNLFKYWGKEASQILFLFGTFIFLTAFSLLKNLKKEKIGGFIKTAIFSLCWFVITLSPVLFFPFHKFSYNLTIPSFGVFFLLSYIMTNTKLNKYFLYLSLTIFVLLNLSTLSLIKKTHWITRGAATASRVNTYFIQNEKELRGKTIVFYDTFDDADLPWSPTNLIKSVLSDQNFFDVFYPGKFKVIYGQKGDGGDEYIHSRIFLGY